MMEPANCPFCGCATCVREGISDGLFRIRGDHSDDCVFADISWENGYLTAFDAVSAWNKRDGE
jgi:hypothetical protein